MDGLKVKIVEYVCVFHYNASVKEAVIWFLAKKLLFLEVYTW